MAKKKIIVTPEKIALDLAVCKKVFESLNIPWLIIGGVVLGYARYNEIMPWDTDLDVVVLGDLDADGWNRLYKVFSKNNFRKFNKRFLDFQVGMREAPIDLWIFHKNGNFYESFPHTTPGLKFVEKAIWYDEPRMVNFLGDKYPMPNNMEDYLICQYGKDWKDNVVKDHESYYLDKRGSRVVAEWPSGRGIKNGDMWPKILKVNDTMENV